MLTRSFLALVIPMDQLGQLIVTTLAFTVLGILMFALAFFIIVKTAPFSVRKELEEDHNTALAVVIGAVIIGIAMIISAAIHG
jgi:putative membrane protein